MFNAAREHIAKQLRYMFTCDSFTGRQATISSSQPEIGKIICQTFYLHQKL